MKYKNLQFIVILFFSNVLFSQTDIVENGYNKFYYPNGSLQSEGYLKDGKPEGYWKNYYPTGVLKSEGNRKNHQLDSTWVFYTITGDTSTIITYLIGKKNGYAYEFYTKPEIPSNIGHIRSKELFVNNLKEGRSFYYYESGKLKEIVEYVGNKKDGRGFVFAEDGRIIMLYKYRKGSITERERLNRFNDEGQRVGVWKTFYEADKVHTESYYREGLLDGYYKEYSINGKLLLTHLYRKGELIETIEDETIESKEVIEYFTDGTIKSSGSFVDDKPIGIHKEYSKDGSTIVSKIYNDYYELISSGYIDTNGYKTGLWEEYNSNGDIVAKGKYVRGRRQGKWEFYYPNGQKEQLGEYDKGKYVGVWKWYYPGGELWKEEEFYNNREEGLYVEYDILGNILVEGEYFDGEREGLWTTVINDYKAVGKYVTGLMDGKWKHYFQNGNLSYEGNYIQGNPDGKHKYFYPDGTLKEEQIYNSGIRQKHWKKYNEEGELIITISYKDDIEYRINGIKVDLPSDIPILID